MNQLNIALKATIELKPEQLTGFVMMRKLYFDNYLIISGLVDIIPLRLNLTI